MPWPFCSVLPGLHTGLLYSSLVTRPSFHSLSCSALHLWWLKASWLRTNKQSLLDAQTKHAREIWATIPPSNTPDSLYILIWETLACRKNRRQPLFSGMQLVIICTNVYKNWPMTQLFWTLNREQRILFLGWWRYHMQSWWDGRRNQEQQEAKGKELIWPPICHSFPLQCTAAFSKTR